MMVIQQSCIAHEHAGVIVASENGVNVLAKVKTRHHVKTPV
jgi:hypothetical protein